MLYLRCDFFGLGGDVDRDGIRRFFERGELAFEQARIHVVIFTRGKTTCDEFVIAFEVNEFDLPIIRHQAFAISVFQSGTGEHEVAPAGEVRDDELPERVEPRQAVGIVERHAGTHFLDVCLRVKVVGIGEFTLHTRRQIFADGRFT